MQYLDYAVCVVAFSITAFGYYLLCDAERGLQMQDVKCALCGEPFPDVGPVELYRNPAGGFLCAACVAKLALTRSQHVKKIRASLRVSESQQQTLGI